MNKKQLIDYMEKVLALEVKCYEQQKIINNLNNDINYYSNPQNNYKCKELKNKMPMFYTEAFKFCGESIIVEVLVLLFGPILLAIMGLPITIVLCAMICTAWGIQVETFFKGILVINFIWFVIMFICEISQFFSDKAEFKRLQEETININREIERKNKEKENYNNNLNRKFYITKQRLLAEKSNIEKQLQITRNVLNNYYALGVIYPAYQKLSCVAYLYEYLVSGSCDSLQGHEGGYNILRTEMKLDRVIQNQEVMMSKLDTIVYNQGVLHDAIDDVYYNIDNMSNKICKSATKISNTIQSSSNQINSRLESIEYTNEINAMNTEFTNQLLIYSMWNN